MDIAAHQHFAWLARSFGRTDYLPLAPEDLAALSAAGEYVDKYPGTHLFKEGTDATAATTPGTALPKPTLSPVPT